MTETQGDPRLVRVLDGPLPRNAGGKVLKTALRDAGGWTEVPRLS